MHYLDGIPQMTNLGPLTHASNTLFLCFLRGLSHLCAGASFYNTSYLQGLNIKQNFRAKKEAPTQKIQFESKRHLVKFLLNFSFVEQQFPSASHQTAKLPKASNPVRPAALFFQTF